MNFKELREKNVKRAIETFKTYDNQPLSYWITAIVGELGELANMTKKMQRVKMGGIDGGHSYTAEDITKKMLAEEIAGVIIYIDLLSSLLEIDLHNAVVQTFNEKSFETGSNITLSLKQPPM